MKTFFTSLGMVVLKFLLNSPAIHEKLREFAAKTDNKFDDLGVEQLIAAGKKLSEKLES